MSLQIAHNVETGMITLRWRFYSPEQRDVLIGFVDGARKLRTTHPALDRIDGQTWGPNLQQQIIDVMKATTQGGMP